MTIEEKLYEIFESRLQQIEVRFANAGKPRWSYWHRLQEEWSEFLEGFKDLGRSSRMMTLVLDKKDDVIRINDPLSTSGNDCVLEIPVDTAMKILALGCLP